MPRALHLPPVRMLHPDGTPLVDLASALELEVEHYERRYERHCKAARVAMLQYGAGSMAHQIAVRKAQQSEQRLTGARAALGRERARLAAEATGHGAKV